MPFAAFHLLVIELDCVDAHVLLRNGDFLLVYEIEDILVDVRHFQAVDAPSLVVFHEVAEIGTVGFHGRGTVPLLFQQFQIAFRQYVCPLWFGMPYVHPAVIYVSVGRIAVVEIRQFKGGSRHVGGTVVRLFHVRILGEQ